MKVVGHYIGAAESETDVAPREPGVPPPLPGHKADEGPAVATGNRPGGKGGTP